MSRPRMPTEKAKITGYADIHKTRFKDRPIVELPPLGDPPASFVAEPNMVRAWEKIRTEIPWLTEADRQTVAIVASLRAQFDEDPRAFPVNKIVQYRQLLGALGATPADRSKVDNSNGEGVEKDPDDYFDN